MAANAAQGNFTVGLEASSGNLQHSVSLALQVQTQAFASFSLSVDSNQLFFLHGGSANTTVSPTVISSGNANYAVQLSVVGLPPGVQATFGANPFVMGQPSTQLTFTANSSATANYVSVIVVATRTADGVQESAQLEINVSPPVGSLPAIRTDFIREDGTPAAAIYDPVHSIFYASNTQWSRVDVISSTSHQILKSIPVPNPTGMDMSLDGKHLIVTSNVQQICFRGYQFASGCAALQCHSDYGGWGLSRHSGSHRQYLERDSAAWHDQFQRSAILLSGTVESLHRDLHSAQRAGSQRLDQSTGAQRRRRQSLGG